MSRTIEFEQNQLVINFTGITSVVALKKHIEVPYESIKKVSIEDFDVPLLQFRIGTSVADIREGRFLLDGKWCFVSYENHKDLLIIDLNEHQYSKIIIQVKESEEIKIKIKEKIQIFESNNEETRHN